MVAFLMIPYWFFFCFFKCWLFLGGHLFWPPSMVYISHHVHSISQISWWPLSAASMFCLHLLSLWLVGTLQASDSMLLKFVINSKNNATPKYKQFLTLNVRLCSWELQINFRVQFNAKQSSNPKQVTLFRNIYWGF